MWLVWVCTINILGGLAHFELYSLSSVLDLQRLQRFNELGQMTSCTLPPSHQMFLRMTAFHNELLLWRILCPIFPHICFLRQNSLASQQWCCDNVWGGNGFNKESTLAINCYAPNLSMSHKNSPKYPRIGGGPRSWRQQKFIWSCLHHVCRSPDQPN